MPGFDGTGPNGLGPMSGRKMGQCASGKERGFGRGCRNRANSCRFLQSIEPLSIEDEIKNLELCKKRLEKRIEALKKDGEKNG